MSPNSNDDLNNLAGKMNKGQYVPPNVPPPPIVGGSMMNVGQAASSGNGVRNFFCCIIFFIIITSVVPFVLMSWIFSDTGKFTKFAMDMSTQMTEKMPEFSNSIEIIGDVTKYDPVAGYNQALGFAGDGAKLTTMEARYVKSDGTMDLMADYHAEADYGFVRELAEPPADAPPVGAGGSLDDKWYETIKISVRDPGQSYHVTSMGGNFSYSGYYTNKGMAKDVNKPVSKLNDVILDMPVCSFADLWKVAIEKGSPQAAVATISYDEKGYEFKIRDTQIDLMFDNNCKLIEEKSRFGETPEPTP